MPYHVFVQQLLTLVLQSSDFTGSDWPTWIGKVQAFKEMQSTNQADEIVSFAIKLMLIAEDGGRLHPGPEPERRLGRRHFSELLSVVTSEPLFQVRYGRLEVGFVHPVSFAANKDEPVILALGGRGWQVTHLDWSCKIAYVEASQEPGRSRWMGSSVPLSPALCSSIRRLLRSTEQPSWWSRRAVERLGDLRQELSHCCSNGSVIARKGLSLEWRTFAGLVANQTLVYLLQSHIPSTLRADNLWIKLPGDVSIERLTEVVQHFRLTDAKLDWEFQQSAADLLKFSDLLPHHLLRDLMMAKMTDIPRAREILRSPMLIVDCH